MEKGWSNISRLKRYTLANPLNIQTINSYAVSNNFGDVRRGVDENLYVNVQQHSSVAGSSVSLLDNYYDLENPMQPTAGRGYALNSGRNNNGICLQPYRKYTVWKQAVNVTYTGRQQKVRNYEFTDHLGNVRAVLADYRVWTDADNNNLSDFTERSAAVQSYSDYYPFGMLMPGRNQSSEGYRYGFQGQEIDNEIKGNGNSVNYKYRMHDPRLGRFFAVDPLAAKYPYNSVYAFSENRVIDGVELEGLEWQAHDADGNLIMADGDGNYSQADQERITGYNWVGYNKFAYINYDGSISSDPYDADSKQIGVGAAEGTVATAELWTDTERKFYTSDNVEQKGNVRTIDAVTIYVNRIAETNSTTEGHITVAGTNITGSTWEPEGPSTTVANQDKKIPAGTYNVVPHGWRVKATAKHGGYYVLTNDDVAASRNIMIHAGENRDAWTDGCIVAGYAGIHGGFTSSKTTNLGLVSRIMAEIDRVGAANTRVIVTDGYGITP